MSAAAVIDDSAHIWAYTQVREGAIVGPGTSVGSHSYIDENVDIGQNCKIQSGVLLFQGLTVDDGVFVGPGVVVTNDFVPRAVNPDFSRKDESDWKITETHIKRGASLGAQSVLIAGITIGEFALVGAGAVVTRDVPPNALVVGNPARVIGWVCACGERLPQNQEEGTCPECRTSFKISFQ